MSPKKIERPGNIHEAQRRAWVSEVDGAGGEAAEAGRPGDEALRRLADMVAPGPSPASIAAHPDLDAVISAYEELRAKLAGTAAGREISRVLDALRDGAMPDARYEDLMYIKSRFEDPRASRSAEMLLMLLNFAYNESEDQSEQVLYDQQFRRLIRLARSGFDPEAWTAQLRSVLSEMIDSGDLSSIASLKAWRKRIGLHSTPSYLVNRFLYTLLFYEGEISAGIGSEFDHEFRHGFSDEETGEVIRRFFLDGQPIARPFNNRAAMEALIPLGFVAASLRDQLDESFTHPLLRAALYMIPRRSRKREGDNIRGIVQYGTVLLGYMAVNLQRTGEAGVSCGVLEQLDQEYLPDDVDTVDSSKLFTALEAIVQMLGNPELREYVATTESLDQLVEIYRELSDVSTSVAEEARTGRQRRRTPPRRGNPRGNRAASHASARTGRSPRIGLTARTATRFRAV